MAVGEHNLSPTSPYRRLWAHGTSPGADMVTLRTGTDGVDVR